MYIFAMPKSLINTHSDLTSGDFQKVFKLLPEITSLETCWEWQGYKNIDGRGRVYLQGKQWLVSHIMWMLTYQTDIPSGVLVTHDCDNAKCVNPFHLRLGTQHSNCLEAVKRDRRRTILSTPVVKYIRNSTVPTKALARLFQVTPQTIRNARKGVSWKL